MKYRNLQLNNKGLSLVELIVTILIIAILSTSTVLSISVVYNSDTERAAKVFVASMNEARQKCITVGNSENSASVDKTEVFATLYLNADGFYCVDVSSSVVNVSTGAIAGSEKVYDTKQLCKYKNTFDCGVYNAGAAMTMVDPDFEAGDKVVFSFDKGSGGIKESYVEKTDGTTTSYDFTDVFVRGSRSTVNMVLVRQTGRCYIYE